MDKNEHSKQNECPPNSSVFSVLSVVNSLLFDFFLCDLAFKNLDRIHNQPLNLVQIHFLLLCSRRNEMKRFLTTSLLVASLACLPFALGCDQGPTDPVPVETDDTPVADVHDHDVGPNNGPLAVLGSHEYHAEVLPVEETGQVTVYLTDPDFKPIAIEEATLKINMKLDGSDPKQYTLERVAGTELPVTFIIEDKELAEILTDGWEGDVTVAAKIDGAPISGALAKPKAGHADHDDHEEDDHDEDHEDHDEDEHDDEEKEEVDPHAGHKH